MTVHAAKGLEFHTVFVTGLEEGLFPHENSLGEYGGIEEERRLAYVAITRARRRLYLTHAQSRMLHGQLRYNVASRFLDEMPAGMVQWLSPKRGNFASEPEARAERNAAQRMRDGSGWRRRCPRSGEFSRRWCQVAGAGIRQAAAGMNGADS